METWVFAGLCLRRLLGRDVGGLVLECLYPFRAQTWKLKGERADMIIQCPRQPVNKVFRELLLVTSGETGKGGIKYFLDVYSHQVGPYWVVKGGNVMYSLRWSYKQFMGDWVIGHYMVSSDTMTALQLSNRFDTVYKGWSASQLEKHESLCAKPVPRIKFPKKVLRIK